MGDSAAATATTACGAIDGNSSTGTGGARARRSRRGTAPRLQLKQDAALFAPSARACSRRHCLASTPLRASRCARTPQHQPQPQDRSTRTHTALRSTHRARPPCAATYSSAPSDGSENEFNPEPAAPYSDDGNIVVGDHAGTTAQQNALLPRTSCPTS